MGAAFETPGSPEVPQSLPSHAPRGLSYLPHQRLQENRLLRAGAHGSTSGQEPDNGAHPLQDPC